MLKKFFLQLNNQFLALPAMARQIVVGGSLLFILWKGVYLFFLLPTEWPDKPLTTFVTQHTCWLMPALTSGIYTYSARFETITYPYGVKQEFWGRIYKNGKVKLHIAHSCNGLELMVLYVGLLIVLPGRWKIKLLFAVVGVLLLYSFNIFRCCGLLLMLTYWPQQFAFAHHYAFKIIMYFFTFLGWYLYLQSQKKIIIENAGG